MTNVIIARDILKPRQFQFYFRKKGAQNRILNFLPSWRIRLLANLWDWPKHVAGVDHGDDYGQVLSAFIIFDEESEAVSISQRKPISQCSDVRQKGF